MYIHCFVRRCRAIMNENHLVTVIVPIYNGEKYIEQTAKSILRQTYKNIELILVNDGSKDNSLDIIEKIALRDKKIKVINKTNGGVSSARNSGIKAATGKYVMFVDSDDYLPDKAVENMVNANNDDYDLIIGSYYSYNLQSQTKHIFDNAKVLRDTAKYFSDNFNKDISSSVWAKLYKRDSIKTYFNEDITFGEDLLFNCSYFCGSDKIKVINDLVYGYNQTNSESIVTVFKEKYYYQINAVCDECKNILEKSVTDIDTINVSRKLIDVYVSYLKFFSKKKYSNFKTAISKTKDDKLNAAYNKSHKAFGLYSRFVLYCALKSKLLKPLGFFLLKIRSK